MTVKKGVQVKLLHYMTESPDKLFTMDDLCEKFNLTKVQAENGLLNLRKKESIHEHCNRNNNNMRQFAVNIQSNNIRKIGNNRSPSKARSLTIKDMRGLISSMINDLTKIEDIMANSLTELEAYKKERQRILNSLK